jgi:hypothetical protein
MSNHPEEMSKVSPDVATLADKYVDFEVLKAVTCLDCFHPEDGGSMFLRNVGELLPYYLTSHSRTQ